MESLLQRQLYAMTDVDRYLGLKPGTARRWIDGYVRAGVVFPPVVRPQRTGVEMVTWGEFVETRLLAAFGVPGVTLRKFRPAVERLRRELDAEYPFATASAFLETSGMELVHRVQVETELDPRLHLVVVRSGQLELTPPATEFIAATTYHNGVVVRLTSTLSPAVHWDPLRAFGRPAVRAVPTESLAEAFSAGDSIDTLADLYELTTDQVQAAVRFELSRAQERTAA